MWKFAEMHQTSTEKRIAYNNYILVICYKQALTLWIQYKFVITSIFNQHSNLNSSCLCLSNSASFSACSLANRLFSARAVLASSSDIIRLALLRSASEVLSGTGDTEGLTEG